MSQPIGVVTSATAPARLSVTTVMTAATAQVGSRCQMRRNLISATCSAYPCCYSVRTVTLVTVSGLHLSQDGLIGGIEPIQVNSMASRCERVGGTTQGTVGHRKVPEHVRVEA